MFPGEYVIIRLAKANNMHESWETGGIWLLYIYIYSPKYFVGKKKDVGDLEIRWTNKFITMDENAIEMLCLIWDKFLLQDKWQLSRFHRKFWTGNAPLVFSEFPGLHIYTQWEAAHGIDITDEYKERRSPFKLTRGNSWTQTIPRLSKYHFDIFVLLKS